MTLRAVGALIRASWRTALSYRLRFAISTLSIVVMVLPIYFLSRAVQPIMAPLIENEGAQYFAFVIIGLFAASVVSGALYALPQAITADFNTGFFEAVVSTPAGIASVALGLSGYTVLRHSLRGVALVFAGALFGMQLMWWRLPEALLIIALIAIAHFGLGLIAAALVIAFRTDAAVPQGVLLLSGLLGGVYYPTSIIPSWIATVADYVPLTYGLRALRHTLLNGEGLEAVVPELSALALFAVALSVAGAIAYRGSLHYARQAGSLSQY
ncbi:MAG: ABC transporter permease [Gemmatimonadaceae bacterium]